MNHVPRFATSVIITSDLNGHPMGSVGVVVQEVEATPDHSAGAVVAFPDGDQLYVSLPEMTTDLGWLPPRDREVLDFVSNVLAREYSSQKPKKDRVARYLIEHIDSIRAEHDAKVPGPKAIEAPR